MLDGRPEDNGVSCAVFWVTAKCHRSMRKNEALHDISAFITCFDDVHQSQAHHCVCSCAIGTSGNCGHIISLLYQLAEYKALGLNYIHVTASTMAQTNRSEDCPSKGWSDATVVNCCWGTEVTCSLFHCLQRRCWTWLANVWQSRVVTERYPQIFTGWLCTQSLLVPVQHLVN